MLSSTHDPYIPELRLRTRLALEVALSEGVRFCIQTRSLNVLADMELLARYREQVRVQVSLATSDENFAQVIEPRAPSPHERLRILREAKELGIRTGVIVAPVFPPLTIRPDVRQDLRTLASLLSEVKPDHVFGETLHHRGGNYQLLGEVLREPIHVSNDFDNVAGSVFRGEMKQAGLRATWWSEGNHLSRTLGGFKSAEGQLAAVPAKRGIGGDIIWESV